MPRPFEGERLRQADLTIHEVRLYTKMPTVNRPVEVLAIVGNSGNQTLDDVKVQFYLGRKQMGVVQYLLLIPNEKRELVSHFMPRAAGTYIVSAVVDPGNQVPEISEENNRRVIKFEIKAEKMIKPLSPPEIFQPTYTQPHGGFETVPAISSELPPLPQNTGQELPPGGTGRRDLSGVNFTALPPGKGKREISGVNLAALPPGKGKREISGVNFSALPTGKGKREISGVDFLAAPPK